MKSRKYYGYTVYENGDVINKLNKKLKTRIHKNGYRYIDLSYKDRKMSLKLHRILGKLFIPNPENKPEINHKNGIKLDNRLENMEWVTHKENCIHAAVNGLRIAPKGRNHAQSIPVFQFDLQGNFINYFGSSGEAERLTGVWHTNICKNVLNQRPTAGGYIWRKAI